VCHECCAVQPFPKAPRDMNYANFRLDALWRESMIDTRAYLNHDPEPTSWRHVRGFNLGLCIRDCMHDEYLGFCRDLVASLLIDLLDTGRLGPGTHDALLEELFMDMCDWSKQQGYSMPRGTVFSLSTLGRGTSRKVYPELSSTFKAASVKTVCIYMARKVLDVHVPGDNHSKVRSTCAWAYSDYLHTLDVGDRLLSPVQRDRAASSGRLFLLSYQTLAEEAIARRTFLYKVRPKHHDYDHVIMLLEGGSVLNPRFLSCFAEEDLMGKLKLIGLKCSRQTASLRILESWLLTVDRRWRGLSQDWSLHARF
jgi:hypothetical protein